MHPLESVLSSGSASSLWNAKDVNTQHLSILRQILLQADPRHWKPRTVHRIVDLFESWFRLASIKNWLKRHMLKINYKTSYSRLWKDPVLLLDYWLKSCGIQANIKHIYKTSPDSCQTVQREEHHCFTFRSSVPGDRVVTRQRKYTLVLESFCHCWLQLIVIWG